MTLAGRAELGLRRIIIAVVWLVIIGAIGRFAAVAWGADADSPPPTISEEAVRLDPVVVSAGRIEQRLRDVPANVTVITREEIAQSPARTVDDLLRQIPGFSLFRRSSSLVTHPTTQGVSLRGIGPSGVSRTLVLLDGVPLNDPFGGWVYWSKVPLESVEQIEVARGGGSGVWGNYALGGVINIITKRPEARVAQLKVDGGTRNTVDTDLLVSHVTGPWGISLEGSFFDTDGYKIVKKSQRGTIDVDADSSHKTFNGRLEYTPSPTSSLFLAGTFFREDRGNGTPLQNNETETGYVATGGRMKTADGSDWQLTAFSHLQTFNSTFTSASADRNSETPALDQFDVPSTDAGANLQWSKRILQSHLLTAGTDVRWIDGETNEYFTFNQTLKDFTGRRKAGGEQFLAGAYIQDIFTPAPGWQITVAGRFDSWQSFNASRVQRNKQTGAITRNSQFDDRDEFAFSPKVALLYHATDQLSLRSSFYKGFRAPTINEQFRPFRVRNDITEANEKLDPERLIGGEVGFDYTMMRNLLGRFTAFWNEVKDPIVNVTKGIGQGAVMEPCGFVPVGGVCRQRDNLDRTRIRGIEAELEYHPLPRWAVSGSYLYNHTEVLSAKNQPELEGKWIAQVPRHQFTLKLGYTNPSLVNFSIQGRFIEDQFEDDLNTLKLGDYFVVDLMVWRPIPLPKVSAGEIFFAVENLFDRTYEVAKTADGIVTTGTPVLVHGGVRVRF
ncbi:MAG: TonB-dependent receptor [Candidatus Methylomirabilis oxygeniifera]|uniref:Putative TonB-dependent receptor n=1 Tax=Methylomirabilis oxygeniifera TaxID=671143 RepID=D5MHT3_METO1|nr:MAG: TonB-dependent receptor [Candidatus Methylomirabilis oxyfera]CBE67216.1 putative TonB-dependent receptor [Candidatus Methylomirabilis oxyfera]